MFIWAVNSGRVLEGSFGYYITPLVNMASGALIFRERIDRLLCLVEDRLGFQIFEAIDRVKRELSLAAAAEFSFPYPSIEITETVERAAFDRSSAASPSP